MNDTEKALDSLVERWNSHYRQSAQGFAQIEHDSDWPSVCELSKAKDGQQVSWQPVLRDDAVTFENIEHALDMPIHEGIKTYYSRYLSGEMAVFHEKGPVFLLQIWNDEDFNNLQENMIGHVLMKRRLRQEITLFFALTDDENLLLSIKNDSGEIWLESVGKEPHLKLADSMAEFLNSLTLT